MTGTPDDRFDDHDLDRLLAELPPSPPMREGLVDRIVSEAQRTDRIPVVPAGWKPRPSRRAWTRRGVWTGVIALNLIFASAVAAAFGGGVLSVAKIRTVAAAIVEHIHHPYHHGVVAPHRMPSEARPVHLSPQPSGPVAVLVPHSPVATMTAVPAVALRPLARPVAEGRRGAVERRDVKHIGPHAWHRGVDRAHPSFRGPGSRHAAPGAVRPFKNERRDARIATSAPRFGGPSGAGPRPDAPMHGGWQRPAHPMDSGFARGGQFGDGWRHRPWARGPGFRPRRFGPGARFGAGPGRRFGPRGGRGRGRPFRRRF